MARKTQQGHFISLPRNFKPQVIDRNRKHFQANVSGVYATWNHDTVWLQYSGEDAEKSMTVFELPADPDYIREFAEGMLELADKLES